MFTRIRKNVCFSITLQLILLLIDENECDSGAHNCLSKANCGNLNGHEGKFECFCLDGYVGDGLLNGTGCTGEYKN